MMTLNVVLSDALRAKLIDPGNGVWVYAIFFDGGAHPITLIDNGMPCVILDGAAFGLRGDETPAALEADAALRDRIERVRLAAGPLMNLGDVTQKTVPKMTLVSPARAGGAISTLHNSMLPPASSRHEPISGPVGHCSRSCSTPLIRSSSQGRPCLVSKGCQSMPAPFSRSVSR